MNKEDFTKRLFSKQGNMSDMAFSKLCGIPNATMVMYRKGSMPSVEKAYVIAKNLQVSVDWLLGGDLGTSNFDDPKPIEPTSEKADVQIPALLDDDGMLPVLGTAAGSVIGSIAISGEAIDWVRRPIGLRGAKDAYGLYVTGISMEPRFKTGELVFIHPHRPIRAGDDVIIQTLDNHSDEVISFIKEYVRETENKYVAQQYNPKATVEFLKINVQKLHRVMRLNELVGV